MKRAKVSPQPQPHEYPDTAPQPRGMIAPSETTVRNDEVYPVKRPTSPVSLPLALMNEHVLNRNMYHRPKVYNNENRLTDNVQKNNFVRNEDNFYGQLDSSQGT